MQDAIQFLHDLGIDTSSGTYRIISPINGELVGCLKLNNLKDAIEIADRSTVAFNSWRKVPAPKRGELIRLFGEELRKHKQELGRLVTVESGKILQEGLGEVQEMIDICDFAVGLSRQLYGLTMPSERAGHKLMETWHPLGPVAVISAFNFPVAVWSWNFALAIVCGNSVIWKPSEKTPFTALACQKLFEKAVEKFDGEVPEHLSLILLGDADIGKILVRTPKIKLVSATGSTNMGKSVAIDVAFRLGRCLLELGGNNGMIVTPSADLEMALKAIVFSAVGTAGQRCTTLRRVFAHADIYNELVKRIKKAYSTIKIGDPLNKENLVGPLIDEDAYISMLNAMHEAAEQGGTCYGGGNLRLHLDTYYVEPAIVEMPSQTNIVKNETFAPILYIMKYENFDDAIKMHNDVPQGLSSCIFSTDIRETEKFLAESDCGIANVNIGPSGAEIGGAFGGEKDTGGGRESGSDAWKNYMRRATNTINFSDDMPLAQGINFDL